jgi:hypothetical protein
MTRIISEALPQTDRAKTKSSNRQGAKDAKVLMLMNPRIKASLSDLSTFAVNASDFQKLDSNSKISRSNDDIKEKK